MQTFVKVKCQYCGKVFEKYIGYYNRAKEIGAPLYCDKKCAGFGRRKTIEEKKRLKQEYDQKRMDRHQLWFLLWRAFEFRVVYEENPEKYRKERQRRMKAHIEYCRNPEYRKKKKVYDQQRRAKIQYGDYSEAAIALYQLASIVDNRKAKRDQDNINKSKKRRRYGKTYSKKPQERALAIDTSR